MNPQATTDIPAPPPPAPTDEVAVTPAPRKRSEFQAWWESERIVPWCAHIFGGAIRNIIAAGVTSFADFHRKLQNSMQLRIPEDQLRKWLTAMGEPYASLFSRRTLIRVDPATVSPPPTGMDARPASVPDDTPAEAAGEVTTIVDRPLVAGQRPPTPGFNLASPAYRATNGS